MAEPKTEIDRRLDRHQEAIETMSAWLYQAQTGWGQKDHEGIMDILRGDKTETIPEDNTTDIGWYVSDVHCRRAIGYLSVELVEKGYLAPDFESPILLEMWGEALEKTMIVNEPSPIGPDPDLARKNIGTETTSEDSASTAD